MYREQGNTAEGFERSDIGQDTAPRDISICVQGRYPGSQDLTYHLPMNWSIHSGIKSSLKKFPVWQLPGNAIAKQAFYGTLLAQSFLFDTPTPAYRCGGSPGIQESLNKSCGRTYIQRFLNLVPV
jgi:hypothetical protein